MSKQPQMSKSANLAKKTVRISGDASPPQASPTAIKKARPASANRHDASDNNTANFDSMADYDTRTKEELERMLETRQRSYIERERVWKIRIAELEEELAAQREQKTGWMKSDDKINKLKTMHSQILNNVELVQDRTARILQEQERDLLRAFRARLFDVQAELEKEKNKKDDGAAAWIERNRQLEAEVEWAKEVADRVERVNQTLLQENTRLKTQFTSQEEDRNFLIKQLVAVKKDNARLRAEYTELESENEHLKQTVATQQEKLNNQPSSGPPGAGAKALAASNSAAAVQQRLDSEERYKDLNNRLRRLLAEERKSLQQVRQNYANELKVRTDMEMLLRQCVEDVRKEIARRYAEDGHFTGGAGGASSNDLAKMYVKQPGLIPVDDFNQGDRERVLELLLSQERVVSLIYAKTFPINTGANSTSAKAKLLAEQGGNGQQSQSSVDLSQLLDVGFDGGPTTDMRPATTSFVANNNNNDGPSAGGGTTKLPSIVTNRAMTSG